MSIRRKAISPTTVGVGSRDHTQGACEHDELIDKQWKTCCSRNLRGVCIICCFIFLILWAGIFYATKIVFPEPELILNSKCAMPMRNWDGKIFNVHVWETGFARAPVPYHNNLKEDQYHGNESNHYVRLLPDLVQKRPVVMWGTHHKTGTYLAKKIFARICARMEWCCLFHVSRDSVHAMKSVLSTEPVNGFGHNQWIWDPAALNINDYKFVHFYRHPFKKIISGYRYHGAGTESWSRNFLDFNDVCQRKEHLSSGNYKNPKTVQTRALTMNGNTTSAIASVETANSSPESEEVSKESVWSYCSSIHLCETCCRLEHEYVVPRDSSAPLGLGTVRYRRRSQKEYDFICKHLGGGNGSSLQDMLQTLPPERGILTEAALDYYENLRMANIVHKTANDSRTLNIDLDDLSANYSDAIWAVLMHLRDLIPNPDKALPALHQELMFFDLNSSPLYRWSMSNPLINHITSSSSSSTNKGNLKGSTGEHNGVVTSVQLLEALRSNTEITHIYGPVLKLMDTVLEK